MTGTLTIGGGGYTIHDLKSKEAKKVAVKGSARAHMVNFLDAIRHGKPLNSEIAEGHKSTLLCHLGNIAYRLGRKLHINPSSESFVNDSEADSMLSREYRAPFIVPNKV